MLRKAIPLSYLDDPIRQCSAAPAKPLAADFRSFDVKSENSSLAVTLFGAVCVGAGTALLIARIFIFTVHVHRGPLHLPGSEKSASNRVKNI